MGGFLFSSYAGVRQKELKILKRYLEFPYSFSQGLNASMHFLLGNPYLKSFTHVGYQHTILNPHDSSTYFTADIPNRINFYGV